MVPSLWIVASSSCEGDLSWEWPIDLCCHLDGVTLSNYNVLNVLSAISNTWIISEAVLLIALSHWQGVLFFLTSLSPHIVWMLIILGRKGETEVNIIHVQKWHATYFASLSLLKGGGVGGWLVLSGLERLGVQPPSVSDSHNLCWFPQIEQLWFFVVIICAP